MDSPGAIPIPPVRRGSAGSGQTSVDQNTLKYFADVIDSVLPWIDEALKRMKTITVLPGNFHHAEEIQKLVGGEKRGGTAEVYIGVLDGLKKGLGKLSLRMSELAKTYETAESLSRVSADRVSQILTEVGTDLAG